MVVQGAGRSVDYVEYDFFFFLNQTVGFLGEKLKIK